VHLTQITGIRCRKWICARNALKPKVSTIPLGFRWLIAAWFRSLAGDRSGCRRRGTQVRGCGLLKPISRRPAGWLRGAIRSSPSRSKDWSKPCTKARRTLQSAEAFRQNRDLSDRLKLLQKRLTKAIESEDFEEAASFATRSNKLPRGWYSSPVLSQWIFILSWFPPQIPRAGRVRMIVS